MAGDSNGVIVIPKNASLTFSIYNYGLVFYYYDLGFGSFSYFTSAIAMAFCAYTLLLTALGLIKRLFLLTTLFIVSPPICAIYPIDDGKALESWRKEFIKETLSAYSVVVVMNIFLSLLPLVRGIELFSGSSDLKWLGSIPGITAIANYFARVLIVIGGLVFFKDASKTIAGIIGAGDASADGAGASGKLTSGVKRTAGGLALGAGAAFGAARLAGKGIGLAGKGVGKGISALDSKIHSNSQAKKLAKADSSNEKQEDDNSMNQEYTFGGDNRKIFHPGGYKVKDQKGLNIGDFSGASDADKPKERHWDAQHQMWSDQWENSPEGKAEAATNRLFFGGSEAKYEQPVDWISPKDVSGLRQKLGIPEDKVVLFSTAKFTFSFAVL